MWLRLSVCLLYLQQLVLFLELEAGHLFSNSNTQPSAAHIRQTDLPSKEISHQQYLKSKISKGKPVVKMKPVTLSYLRQNLHSVSSRQDLARLFSDPDVSDHHLRRWLSRSARSAPQAPGPGIKLSQTDLEDQLVSFSGKDHSIDQISSKRYASMKGRSQTVSGYRGVIKQDAESSVDEVEPQLDEDEGYDFDYAEDEPSQDALEVFEAALHHIDEIETCSASRCKHPMPYVQSVRNPYDLMRVYIPECVVLHRCMNYTGCCGDGNHVCAPKRMSVVTKAFLVVDRLTSHDDHVMFNPNMAVMIDFVNHTECECREKPRLPKCTKTCPPHFRRTREGIHCKCDCFPLAYQDSWPCESIKEGLVPLSRGGLECIKKGNCYIPQCKVGEFDIKSGLCPLSDNYALPALLFDKPDERHFYREHLHNFDFSTSHSKYTLHYNNGTVPTSSGSSSSVTDSRLADQNKVKYEDAARDIEESSSSLNIFDVSVEAKTTLETDIQKNSENVIFSVDNINISKAVNEKHPHKSRSHKMINTSAFELESLSSVPAKMVTLEKSHHHRLKYNKSNERFSSDDVTDDGSISESLQQRDVEKPKYDADLENSSETIAHRAASKDKNNEKANSEYTSHDKTSSQQTVEDVARTPSMSEGKMHHTVHDVDTNKKTSLADKEHIMDDLARRTALRNSFGLRFHINSQSFHENFRSAEATSKLHSDDDNMLSDVSFQKPVIPSKPTSSTLLSLLSSPVPSPPSFTSDLTSAYVSTKIHESVSPELQMSTLQTIQHDQEYSQTSEDTDEETFYSYDYDTLDSFDEESEQNKPP